MGIFNQGNGEFSIKLFKKFGIPILHIVLMRSTADWGISNCQEVK
jgi:hypothetical protein